MKIYVGNLADETVEADVMEAFQEFGDVQRVNIARTSLDGLSRGFGFVDVDADADGRAMIRGLNGSLLLGKALKVTQAFVKRHAS